MLIDFIALAAAALLLPAMLSLRRAAISSPTKTHSHAAFIDADAMIRYAIDLPLFRHAPPFTSLPPQFSLSCHAAAASLFRYAAMLTLLAAELPRFAICHFMPLMGFLRLMLLAAYCA